MKRRVKIQQHDTYDCGAACLSSIAAWYGLYIPLNKVKRFCNCTKEGITIKGIIDGAAKLGLEANAFKSTDKKLDIFQKSIQLPAIAHLKKKNGFYHFVTITSISSKYIEIMEPSCGEFIKLPYNEFKEEWTGYIINLSPTLHFYPGNQRRGVYRRLFSLLLSTKREILHSAAGSITLVAGGVIMPLFLQHIIDNVIPMGKTAELAKLSGIVILLAILMLFISHARNIYAAAHGMRIDNHLIYNYIRKIFHLPSEYFNQYTAGDLNSRVSDAFNIRLFISEGVISVLICAITISASLIIIFKLNKSLAILSVAFIPMYTGLFFFSQYINKKYNRTLASSGAQFETDMLQGMDSVISVKHYGAEALSIKRIENSYTALSCNIFNASKAVSMLATMADMLSKGLVVATITAGGFMIFAGTLSIGELVAFYSLCSFYSAPLANLTKMNTVITQAEVSAERLYEIMDIEENEDLQWQQNSIQKNWREIIIEHLDFAYPGREQLFEKLSFKIERGTITAIEGESGCGKSTLASLIMRDCYPINGAIYLDKFNIGSIPMKEWLGFITIIPQKLHLFNATLLDNITCGEENPNTDKVVSICAELGLGDFIQRLPMGLFTHIGSHGSELSGGQMQKIAIARAIYREPQVIIFDESTASVDSRSEEFIMNYIIRLKQMGKTILLISHNKSVTGYADKIVQL